MTNQSANPLAYFAIESPLETVFLKLFTESEGGVLNFGFSAGSVEPADLQTVKSGADFRDYILEGFVKYRLKLQPATFGCMLGIGEYGATGSNILFLQSSNT